MPSTSNEPALDQPSDSSKDLIALCLCKGCGTMKHVDVNGYCGRYVAQNNLPTTKDSDWLEPILDRFDPFDNSHNEFLRRKPQAKAQVQAHVQRLVIEGRIDELRSVPYIQGPLDEYKQQRLADLENQLKDMEGKV